MKPVISYGKLVPPDGFVPPHILANAPPSTPLLLALSGGPDSGTLLHLLAQDAKEKGYPLYAAHVNHGIRGAEADRDEEFCRRLTDSLDIPLFVLRADIPALAKESAQSIETAARNARYDFFETLMQEHKIPLLATAHNADDNAETLLWNMIRGSGLDGLCGIPPVRAVKGGTLVRPLLAVSRKEILAFCHVVGLDYVTDSTNTDTVYTRNRIRAELIPAMERINPSLLDGITRLCTSLREDAGHLNETAASFLKEQLSENAVPIDALRSLPSPILSRALMLWFKEVSLGIALEHCHVDALTELIRKATPHSSASLPNECFAYVENGMLCLQKKKRQSQNIPAYSYPLLTNRLFLSQINCEIVMGNSQSPINIYKKEICLFLPFDTIQGNLIVRSRAPQDTILLGGMHKNVRKLMNEKKIPLDLRKRLPMICDDNGILAIPFVATRDGITQKIPSEQTMFLHFYIL